MQDFQQDCVDWLSASTGAAGSAAVHCCRGSPHWVSSAPGKQPPRRNARW